MIELELDGDNINIRPLLFDVILQDAHGLRLINFDWEGNGFTLEEAEYGVHDVAVVFKLRLPPSPPPPRPGLPNPTTTGGGNYSGGKKKKTGPSKKPVPF